MNEEQCFVTTEHCRTELQSCVFTCSCWMKWPHSCSLSLPGTSSVQHQTTLTYSSLKMTRMTWRWKLCKNPSLLLFTSSLDLRKVVFKPVYFNLSKSFFDKDEDLPTFKDEVSVLVCVKRFVVCIGASDLDIAVVWNKLVKLFMGQKDAHENSK